MLLRPALREGDDPVAPRGRQPLERRVDGGAQPAPVPVEDVAVGLVDDGGHAGDPRREAADEAGLRGVRVDDLRPRGSDEADEPVERHHVRDERNLATQRRHVDEPAPTPAGVREDRGVGLAEGDGEGAVVARAPERHDGPDGVLRGAPDGEARDEVENADQRGLPRRGRSRFGYDLKCCHRYRDGDWVRYDV